MGQVVDSIIAELIGKDNGYTKTFDAATAAHERFKKSVPKVGGFEIAGAEAEKYANRHKKAATDIVAAETGATEKIGRSRRARVASAVAADEAEVKSAKAAAAARTAAAEQEAAARIRISKMVERSIATGGVQPGSGRNLGITVPNERHGQASIPASVLNGPAAPVAAEAEVNHLLADRFDLQQRIRFATGEQKVALQTELETLRRIDTYERAGLSTAEANLRVDREMAAIEAERAIIARKKASAGTTRGVEQFARGAGAYAALGGGPAVAGLATAVGIGITAEVIANAVAYGKAIQNLSQQLGITVTDLQAYQKIARDSGVSTEQLTSAFGQFSSNLGRAQEGTVEQAKVFKALGIDIKNFASAGDALPTVIDRISKIADPAKRAAIETRLFGEEGRRLDALLSGGPEKVSELARSLQETGQALSQKEIQELDKTAREFANLKNQLSVDFARVVAGNSDAIIGLAKSFEILASRIVSTIQKLQLFAASAIAAGNASPELKAAAGQIELGSAAGRAQALHRNTEAIRANAAQRAGPIPRLVGYAGNPADDPTVKAARDRVYNERRGTLYAERARILAAGRSEVTPTPAVQPGNVNTHLLNTLGAPKPPKGKSAEALAREADARQKRFEDELARAQDEYLAAQRQLTGSSEDRLALDKARLRTDHERRLSDIDREANEKQIDASKVKQLKAAEDLAYSAKLQVLAADHAVELANRANAIAEQGLQAEIGHLSAQEGLARTSFERADISRQRLAKERQAEEARLNATIHSTDPNVSDNDKALARDALGRVPQKYADAQRLSDHQNLGPLAAYLDKLPKTAADVREAFEGALVQSIDRANDSLATMLTTMIGIKGEAGQLIEAFIRIGIQLLENKAAASGGLGGGFLSSLASSVGSLFGAGGLGKQIGSSGGALKGFAVGGSMVIGGNPGVDQNMLSLNGKPIARVGHGEVLSVMPNVAASNRQALQRSGGDTIVQQTFVLDARYGITTPQLIDHVNQIASQRAAQAGQVSYRSAVAATPATLQRQDALGN